MSERKKPGLRVEVEEPKLTVEERKKPDLRVEVEEPKPTVEEPKKLGLRVEVEEPKPTVEGPKKPDLRVEVDPDKTATTGVSSNPYDIQYETKMHGYIEELGMDHTALLETISQVTNQETFDT